MWGIFTLSGCHTDMWRQPKVLPQQPSDFFADGQGDRPKIAGTVARGGLRQDDARYRGRAGGKLVSTLPPTLTIDGKKLSTTDPADLAKIMERGRERFTIYCTHCHGQLGDGKGMIAQRGLELRRPPGNYHTDRLRKMPIGHFFDVMTNGFGAMYPYAYRVEVDDRWAIAAYIRALQLSRNAKLDSLDSEDRQKVMESETAPAEGAAHKEGSH
jgi:mono/diheme cytochrome c family protein